MTRSADEVQRAADLLATGLSQAEVARRIGVPRSTLRGWVAAGTGVVVTRRERSDHSANHSLHCAFVERVPEVPFAYLLGLYLGDGCLTDHRAGVYRLRIALDLRYPSIIDECVDAVSRVLPNKVGCIRCPGYVSVNAYSRHWPCLFPQHGSGPKHLRPIVLAPWQERIALELHPRALLRGLIHSDGYRGMNRVVERRYSYPRYMFSNRSPEIRDIFMDACRRVGLRATRCGNWQISVARRFDVALMDTFIGPKS